jgi:hypothetical protein
VSIRIERPTVGAELAAHVAANARRDDPSLTRSRFREAIEGPVETSGAQPQRMEWFLEVGL